MANIFTPVFTHTMDDGCYGREPDVCVDRAGRCWVVWISWRGEGECLMASVRDSAGEWCAPFPVSEQRPEVTHMAVAPWKDGVLVAWIDGRDTELDGLKLRTVQGPAQMDPVIKVMPRRRSPAGLALASDDDRFFLVWTVRLPGGCEVQGTISTDPMVLPLPMRLSHRRRLNLNPAVELAHGHGFVAWQYMTFRGGSRIYARRIADGTNLEEPMELVGTDGGINAMCTLRRSDDGVWIAWHSDMDQVKGQGLVRWIEVGHIRRDGTFHRPVHKMRDVERDGAGEDQGFEFPALAVCDGGRLVVIGRGSQSLRRQDLTSEGWTERGQVDTEGWQCRGVYRCAAAADGILVAGRERSGIVVRLLPSGEDGASPRQVLSLADRLDLSRTAKGIHILGRRVLFGDIHQHTFASDGTGTQPEAYNRARYRYGDDIVAISDHESFLGKRTPPGEWSRYCAVADDFYEPGEFVTLYAFEWTGSMHPGPGHKVVYPPSSDPSTLFSRDDHRTGTSEGLIRHCREAGALVIPHHVGWTGADREHHDDEVQPCYEIVSCHGAYERTGGGPIGTRGDDKEGQFLADLLDGGLRFGFVGGSDGHGLNWHHGVCRMQDSHRSGLTAVFADDVTREAVLEALGQRRCYATSGAKIGLWFEIDGRPMGDVVRPGGISSYRVVVHGTNRLSAVALVTNRGKEIALRCSGTDLDIHGTLPPPSEGESTYYFVRVVQEDGHVAWSSPI